MIKTTIWEAMYKESETISLFDIQIIDYVKFPKTSMIGE